MLQTATREFGLGLMLLVVALVGLVSYWVYRDADAREMDDAGYWGAAVGTAFVIGMIIGGLVAVAVYLSARPDEYAAGEAPFEDARPAEDAPAEDRAHDDLPPVPDLTAERVENATPTAIRGYARRYDDVDATGDPAHLRAALSDLVERGDAAETLGTGREESTTSPGEAADTRRHVGRPQLWPEDGPTAETSDGESTTETSTETTTADAAVAETDSAASREFEWVEA